MPMNMYTDTDVKSIKSMIHIHQRNIIAAKVPVQKTIAQLTHL